MIFQFTHELVLSGRKTQTRRIVKPGDDYLEPTYSAPEVVGMNGDNLVWRWKIGKTYAVCPGRGKKAVGRIEITGIRCEDVRNISWDDAVAEGFESPLGFLDVWTQMHDRRVAPLLMLDHVEMLPSRPAEKYQAWVLEFRLVEPAAAP